MKVKSITKQSRIKVVFTCILALFLTTKLSFGQYTLKDLNAKTGSSVLLTERSVDRPLSMHKGQFQFSFGYEPGIRSKSFNNNGELIDLAKEGIGSASYHTYGSLRYGIFEFLELGLDLNYGNTGVRSKQVVILGTTATYFIDEVNSYKGLNDIRWELSLRPFTQIKAIDFIIQPQISFPTAKWKPDQPSHVYQQIPSAQEIDINYRYNEHNGYGVTCFSLLTGLKFRLSDFAVTLTGNYLMPLGDTKTIGWNSILYFNSFTYSSFPYSFHQANELDASAILDYQAKDWFSLRLAVYYLSTQNGWSEATSDRLKTDPTRQIILSPGYEIQVSPYLRMFQKVGFPVSGKNIAIPLTLYTGFSLNFIK